MKNSSNNFSKDVLLAPLTTLGIGGPARFFVEVYNTTNLKLAISKAKKLKIPFLVIGSGSNLLVNDQGYQGLIIKNSTNGIAIQDQKFTVKGGTNLQKLVNTANKYGFSGLEKLTGIPGTVAGAIYGNAGAYGETISDHLVRVLVFDERKTCWMNNRQCYFEYRESGFKKAKNLTILEAEFKLDRGDPEKLKETSRGILEMRLKKYHPNIKCPGSFFKNIIANNLPKDVLIKIPPDKIVYGKIPAGYLLEEVGAKGKSKNGVKIASYHGNLFINEGNGTAKSFYDLAKKYQEKVKEKFGITLEPEVQLVGFSGSF